MKTYKDKIELKKEIDQILCNSCGKKAIQEERDAYHYFHWSCEIRYTVYGSFPGQHSGNSSYDICRECFSSMFQPLLSKLPPNKTEYTCDDNKTTVTP